MRAAGKVGGVQKLEGVASFSADSEAIGVLAVVPVMKAKAPAAIAAFSSSSS